MEMGVLAARGNRRPGPTLVTPSWPAQASVAEQLQARRQLASIGMPWDAKVFLESLLNGDTTAISLYLQGGMTPYTEYAGQAVIFYVLAQNKASAPAVLAALLNKGLDPNATVATNACPSCFPKQQTLLQIAQRYRHPQLAAQLVKAGARSGADCGPTSRTPPPLERSGLAAERSPAAPGAGRQACLIPPVMTAPPMGLAPGDSRQRVLFVSANQMRRQLAALEGTRWRYPTVGLTGPERAQMGSSDTELLFGPERLVTQRFISQRRGISEYRYRAVVVDEEPGLDRDCSSGAYAMPDGTFATSARGGRAVRRQLVLRPLDGGAAETELAIGYWGGTRLYVGENVRWHYVITPARLVSGTPQALKPQPLAARFGALDGVPKGMTSNCLTLVWRQTPAVQTARQLAALGDKTLLPLVMADLVGVDGGEAETGLIRWDGRTLVLAAVREGSQTVWKGGDLRVTRRNTGQYVLPQEPGVGYGDGVLTVRQGRDSLQIPIVTESLC